MSHKQQGLCPEEDKMPDEGLLIQAEHPQDDILKEKKSSNSFTTGDSRQTIKNPDFQ